MISKAATVDAFLTTLPADERAVFGKVRRLLKKAHPKVEESMKYRMPTYLVGEYHLGAFNKQKHYLCLYLNPEAVDPYRKELKAAGLDCGKSCIRFTKPEKLPLDLVAKIIKEAGKLPAPPKKRATRSSGPYASPFKAPSSRVGDRGDDGNPRHGHA